MALVVSLLQFDASTAVVLAFSLFHTRISIAQSAHYSDNKTTRLSGEKKQAWGSGVQGQQTPVNALQQNESKDSDSQVTVPYYFSRRQRLQCLANVYKLLKNTLWHPCSCLEIWPLYSLTIPVLCTLRVRMCTPSNVSVLQLAGFSLCFIPWLVVVKTGPL